MSFFFNKNLNKVLDITYYKDIIAKKFSIGLKCKTFQINYFFYPTLDRLKKTFLLYLVIILLLILFKICFRKIFHSWLAYIKCKI